MKEARLQEIFSRYGTLHMTLIGDFCLDRYLDIDPSRTEISIETGKEVYNVQKTRAYPGAAGTVLNNLVALGVGQVSIIGFCGKDAEGWQLRQCLESIPQAVLNGFHASESRNTFTYTKPLIHHPGKEPEELNRLDQKNWSPTPDALSALFCSELRRIAPKTDAILIMDQVDLSETGVLTRSVRECLGNIQKTQQNLLMIADSRQGLGAYPPLGYKMNLDELSRLSQQSTFTNMSDIHQTAAAFADKNTYPVWVSMSEKGILAAYPNQEPIHASSLPLNGPIDVVGAGDTVTANLAMALKSGATQREALEISMMAASCVIHQLGKTGVATQGDLLSINRTQTQKE